MAKETVAVTYRHLTHGQLTALLLVQVMAARATHGDRFAAQFMTLAAQRQWGAMAAMASLLSNPGSSPSRSDFRYAVPRDSLLLSLKICCALLVLILTAAGSLWLSKAAGPQPVHAAGVAPAERAFSLRSTRTGPFCASGTQSAAPAKPPRPHPGCRSGRP